MNRKEILTLILVLFAFSSFANINKPHAQILYAGMVTTSTSVSCNNFEDYLGESIEKKQFSIRVTKLLYYKVVQNLSPKKRYKGKDIDVRTKIIFSNINDKSFIVCLDNFYIQINEKTYVIDKNLRDYIRKLTK